MLDEYDIKELNYATLSKVVEMAFLLWGRLSERHVIPGCPSSGSRKACLESAKAELNLLAGSLIRSESEEERTRCTRAREIITVRDDALTWAPL